MGTEDSRGHLFCDGDLVTFSGVEGMTELNGREPEPVRVLGELPEGPGNPGPGWVRSPLSPFIVTSTPLWSPSRRLQPGDR